MPRNSANFLTPTPIPTDFLQGYRVTAPTLYPTSVTMANLGDKMGVPIFDKIRVDVVEILSLLIKRERDPDTILGLIGDARTELEKISQSGATQIVRPA